MQSANSLATGVRPSHGSAARWHRPRSASPPVRIPLPACPFELSRMKTREDDIAYFRRRLAASEHQAGEADSDASRAAHLKLAEHYRQKLVALGASNDPEAD